MAYFRRIGSCLGNAYRGWIQRWGEDITHHLKEFYTKEHYQERRKESLEDIHWMQKMMGVVGKTRVRDTQQIYERMKEVVTGYYTPGRYVVIGYLLAAYLAVDELEMVVKNLLTKHEYLEYPTKITPSFLYETLAHEFFHYMSYNIHGELKPYKKHEHDAVKFAVHFSPLLEDFVDKEELREALVKDLARTPWTTLWEEEKKIKEWAEKEHRQRERPKKLELV